MASEERTEEEDETQDDAEQDVMEEYDYIFGFGSIMNRGTHGENSLPGVAAILRKEFGYERQWNFRSSTGFTALGVWKVTSSQTSQGKDINGVLFKVTQSMIPVFDRREVGYEKVRIPLEYLQFIEDETNSWYQELRQEDRLWLYVPLPSHTKMADESHPLLQSYVDTVLQGCLEWGGEPMAEAFIQTTGGWSTYFLNDTPSSRRPWLYRKDYSTIDRLLQKYASKTYFGDRKHPEEFSSAFHRKMKGTWSIPRRNRNFTGREKELQNLWGRFTAGRDRDDSGDLMFSNRQSQQMVVKVEVAGMGGVGKTQLVTEYCYRHFPRDYGLVVWLNAESSEALVADYRQLLMDLAQENVSKVMTATGTATTSSSSRTATTTTTTEGSNTLAQDTDEIVREVKTRLFRSQVPWLLVFDNLEDRSLLDVFVPRGAGRRGHILVTTRLFEMEWDVDQSYGSLLLGCFNPDESLELLKRAAGARNIHGEANVDAAKKIANRLGHLPLALGMAAAYMLRCDVNCSDYLERYNASEKSGQSLLRHGKLRDYSLSVVSSLSLSLVAIEKESHGAHKLLQLLCFLGPEQITKPLIRHLMSSAEDMNDDDHGMFEKEQRHALWIPIVLSCGLVGVMLTRGRESRGYKNGMNQGDRFLMATTASVLSACLITSYNSPQEDRTKGGNKLALTTRPSQSAFSATIYEDADSAWNILKSFSLLLVKDGKGSMHRLLAQALRQSQTEQDYRRHSRISLSAMQSVWRFKPDEPDTWKESLQVLDHVKSVVSHIGTYKFTSREDRVRAGKLSIEAGIYSAMALNAFIDAQQSFELSIAMFEDSKDRNKPVMQKARADALHELGRVFRYQGKYDESEKSLTEALQIYGKFNSRASTDEKRIADTLHELGVLEVKKHNIDAATKFLELSLEKRQQIGNPEVNAAHAAGTLHQLAAIMVARRPPNLEKAKALLQEALGLSRQIGQRAATLKQLARVTIRQGLLDRAETYLEQALDLYMELYGENKNHINIAAVKFQQGALARQREQWEQSGLHFSACLVIRRNVYAYAKPVGKEEEENPTHLEVSCVLHEIARVAFAQSYFTQAIATLKAERLILTRLEETSEHHLEKIHQSRMTNLTWLRKCAKEIGNESLVTQFSTERSNLKKRTIGEDRKKGEVQINQRYHSNVTSTTLQHVAMKCRVAARKFVLERDNDGTKLQNLNLALTQLSEQLQVSFSDSMKNAASQFEKEILKWKDRPVSVRRGPILEACDVLRDVLRAEGVEINDSISSRRSRILSTDLS